MEIGVILATLLMLIVLYLLVRLVVGPLRIISRFFLNCSIALVTLVMINFIGQLIGVHIPVNLISVMSIGLLGVPGFCMVSFLSYLFI